MLIPETEIIISRDGAELARTTVRPGDYVIGCHAEAEISIAAEGVAERHAQLTVNYNELFIEDSGSGSGTFVGGKRVMESTRLWPSQKVQIGSVVFETRKVKSPTDSDQSLAPQAATVRRVLPEEFLRERKYEIGGLIAQGGMGAVLDAHEATTQRTVAMKVMLSHMSESHVLRFIEEAQITSQLEHPNIVPVHELGVDEHDQVFYTMKLVRGVTLRLVLEKLRAGDAATVAAYPLRRLLIVLMRVCDAMAFAHSRSVIHRDLKPDNVMIGDFGEVLVMDWGLAKVLGVPAAEGTSASEPVAAKLSSSIRSVRTGETESFTMAGSVVGTPHYMSPEQARGETETLDERSDIWALGAILRHALTLEKPVLGETVDEIVENVREGRLPPIPLRAAHCPGGRVPEALIAVTAKAQALDREDRYASVVQFREEIDAYLGGFATKAEQAGLAKQLLLLIQRHKGIFATSFAAWLLITALAVWFVLGLRASEKAAKDAQAIAVEKEAETSKALARSALSLADAALREGNGPAMQAALNDVPEKLRDSTWRYLLDQSDTSIARLRTDTNEIDGVAALPRLPGVFAVSDRTGKVTLLNVRTGERLLQFVPVFPSNQSETEYRLAISPDGERIAVGRYWGGGIVIHSARDGRKLSGWEAAGTERLDFSPDGKRLLQTAIEKENQYFLNVWESANGHLAWDYRSSKQTPYGTHGAFTPDGRQIVTSLSHIHK